MNLKLKDLKSWFKIFLELWFVVSTPNSQEKHQQNQSSFNERFMDYVGNNALPDFIDVGIVQRCVEDLEKG